MKIQTGDPKETGSYVCYYPGVKSPTVIRFWLAGGHGWLSLLREPIAGKIAGWIGPLPDWPENGIDGPRYGGYVSRDKAAAVVTMNMEASEYDL